jgi:sugar transferase (PEP-CTERM/EpsH1 system associated)
MNVETLFLCHRLPFPPNKGDKIRSHAILTHLSSLGPVHVGCFIDDRNDLKYQADVRAMARGECHFVPLGAPAKWLRATSALALGRPITTSYFRSPALQQWVGRLLSTRKIENVVVFGSAMAPYLIGDERERGRVLFDMVDVDSDKWRQYAAASSGPLRWIYAREARALERLERRAASAFGKNLLVSEFEAETFRKIAPESANKIEALGNGVDLSRFSPDDGLPSPFSAGEQAIVMTGRMDYRPNYSGAIWFTKTVAPFLFDRLPGAHVYFVGSGPPGSLRRLANTRVTITGNVTDVRPYLQHASAVIAPLLLARGVQNKVLEAMAMKKAVVATYEAARSLDVIAGRHLWIENDPKRFADAIVAAVQAAGAEAVSKNARQYIEERHSWDNIFRQLDNRLTQLRSPHSTMSDLAACDDVRARSMSRPREMKEAEA